MIEVEKKFQPNEEQLRKLLDGAEFLGEKEYEDFMFDYPDHRYFKKGFRLRKRNGVFELKLKERREGGIERSEEIEDEAKILEKLGLDTNQDLMEFTDTLEVLATWKTKRRKYKKNGLNIDIDETSYGYNVCEIECMVEDPAQTEEAEEKIMKLARECGFVDTKLPPKMKEYFRVMKPELYKELYN